MGQRLEREEKYREFGCKELTLIQVRVSFNLNNSSNNYAQNRIRLWFQEQIIFSKPDSGVPQILRDALGCPVMPWRILRCKEEIQTQVHGQKLLAEGLMEEFLVTLA